VENRALLVAIHIVTNHVFRTVHSALYSSESPDPLPRAPLLEYRALSVKYKALLVEYRALLSEHRALSV